MKQIITLKFQIAIALLLIMGLFVGMFTMSIKALDEQQSYNTLLTVANKLEQTEQAMVSQAMVYIMNKPENAGSYQRDIRIYFQELMTQVELFDEITMSFMREDFSPSLTRLDSSFHPNLDSITHNAITTVEEVWAEFRDGLAIALGESSNAPRLEEAAHYINNYHLPLSTSLNRLMAEVKRLVNDRLLLVKRLYWGLLLVTLLITSGIVVWFINSILVPMQRAVEGFNKVAQGDFGYQVPVSRDDEIARMTHSFNHLSGRLHTIFQLIDRIQGGSDLNEVLGFVAEAFPRLLPLDWVGVLIVAADNSTVVLERSYSDGLVDHAPKKRFRLSKTLLRKALNSGEPLHIPDMLETGKENSEFQFLNYLIQQGRRDAIFLPVTELSPIPVVFAFACRKAESYTPEHLELMTNIASLVTHSFGRTVKLAEHACLATIGEFASGIAHEIRSPLSTITMALAYFQQAELPGASSKRASLAYREAERMARLLEEMLLYAKPLELNIERVDLHTIITELCETNSGLITEKGQRFDLAADFHSATLLGDRDRLIQIFLNLARNACEAAPEGSSISWRLTEEKQERMVVVEITNEGDEIPQELQQKLFEPFFTTKSGGTGLGLSIVKRMVEAHGGEIYITSPPGGEINAKVSLPLADR
ncbi:MAG: ATP-binding protein [Candidatus Sedimenticola sp. (ex Thyasira tokunagai)]